MHYVYILISQHHPTQRYVGMTANLRERFARHNAGRVSHTARYRPWRIATYIALPTKEQAADLERYLKSGSGRAFANRRLLCV